MFMAMRMMWDLLLRLLALRLILLDGEHVVSEGLGLWELDGGSSWRGA
jgi:hypothetical protein